MTFEKILEEIDSVIKWLEKNQIVLEELRLRIVSIIEQGNIWDINLCKEVNRELQSIMWSLRANSLGVIWSWLEMNAQMSKIAVERIEDLVTISKRVYQIWQHLNQWVYKLKNIWEKIQIDIRWIYIPELELFIKHLDIARDIDKMPENPISQWNMEIHHAAVLSWNILWVPELLSMKQYFSFSGISMTHFCIDILWMKASQAPSYQHDGLEFLYFVWEWRKKSSYLTVKLIRNRNFEIEERNLDRNYPVNVRKTLVGQKDNIVQFPSQIKRA